MSVCFIETPIFKQMIARYLDDESLRSLQNTILVNPDLGKLIKGSGGLRKLRFANSSMDRGKRGGLRIIYYKKKSDLIYLLIAYKKNQQDDLSPKQLKILKSLIKE